MLIESSKYQESPPPLTSAGKKFVKLSQQNIIRYSDFIVDQATPRFELGKKDLQSPALPLGHVAKTIQKIYENIPFFFWGGGVIHFCTCILNTVLFNPFPKKDPYFSLWIGYISSIDCTVS